jgi:RNA polymerase sigma factor (TIGR02999 family)
VTELLIDWHNGDQSALDALIPLVYDELRRLAGSYLRRRPTGHTLQPTALVHEAYLKLAAKSEVEWQNRAHFIGVAAHLMRCILVDHFRAKHADKREGSRQRLSLDAAVSFPQQQNEIDLMALDDALKSLEAVDPQQCRIVEMRFFGGLTVEETAEVLGVSPRTVKREWSTAKLWLLRQLSKG